jgi:transposase
VRRVKRATRRKYTPEEKVRIVLEGFRGEIGVTALCRREDIHPTVYYAWLKDVMEAGKARLQADSARDATQVEVEALKRERDQLKQLVAELSLQVHILKNPAPPPRPSPATPPTSGSSGDPLKTAGSGRLCPRPNQAPGPPGPDGWPSLVHSALGWP